MSVQVSTLQIVFNNDLAASPIDYRIHAIKFVRGNNRGDNILFQNNRLGILVCIGRIHEHAIIDRQSAPHRMNKPVGFSSGVYALEMAVIKGYPSGTGNPNLIFTGDTRGLFPVTMG